MKVALISSYEVSGGAGVAAHRLWQGLSAMDGLEIRCFVEHRELPDSKAVLFSEPGRRRRIARDISGWLGLSSHRRLREWEQERNLDALIKHLRWTKPDVINLHGFNQWTIPGLARSAVPVLAEIAPVVWTLHDVWPLTGDREFLNDNDTSASLAHAENEDDRRLKSLGARLTWVGPSRWITGLAAEKFGSHNVCTTIPYGVDTDSFSPMNRAAARIMWNIPEDALVVSAISIRLHDPRKGIKTLLEAAARSSRPIYVLLAGRHEKTLTIPSGLSVNVIGPINDARLIRSFYSASNLVAVPSRQDNLPNVILEAFACGVPVIGSRVGGIPDAVREGETGWLAEVGDVSGWAGTLTRAMDDVAADPEHWSSRCRKRAVRDYSLRVQAEGYNRLFHSITGHVLVGS